MTVIGGRGGRHDDWSSEHARARARAAERLDGPLDAPEAAWLDEHLASCKACATVAADYAAQRLELRTLRDRPPVPPRDLWARTAAAIEHESRFRDQRGLSGDRRRRLTWAPVFAAALVVAVVVGTLTSSRLLFGGGPTAQPGSSGPVAEASGDAPSSIALATPIAVGQHVQWITQDAQGNYKLRDADVREVCPNANDPCDAAAPVQDQHLDFTTDPQTVFGSKDGSRLIVVNGADVSQPASISVVAIQPEPNPTPAPTERPKPTPTESVAATSSPSAPTTASAGASKTPTPSGGAPSTKPPASPTPTPATGGGPSASPSTEPTPPPTPTPTVAITPSPTPGGAIEIAQDVVLVGQSAAYSPSGDWFAFTARPADGSTGPDIYVWKVGKPAARALTTDHRSVFGSWLGANTMVGSSVADAKGDASTVRGGVSYLLDPETGKQVPLPQTGRTWRPSVDPSGRRAVYWAGSLRRSTDAPVDLPDDGRLVIGDWATGKAASSGAPEATQLSGDQGEARHETTIAAGPLSDWDARWDASGTKLAVWIADPKQPNVGSLSLYDVDPFNGRVDLKKPLLDPQRATTGFSISDGKLVWAEPAEDGSGSGRILVFAWTDQGAGTIETLPDKVLVIR
jgi:predicted anti-sigma-YlaC factor YlaD